jgi:hypothetical protein
MSPGTGRPSTAPHLTSLLRHFADLRDGTHGGRVTREDKERLFGEAAGLLDGPARRVLQELNADLLLGTGTVEATGVTRSGDGGVEARWTLSWPEQRHAEVDPITIRAHYGRGFHHPHLGGATVGEWPLNVFTAADADDQVPVMRAIVTADLHNLVFQRDYQIVPATTRSPSAS